MTSLFSDIIIAVIAAFGTGGIAVAYFKYRTEKPKVDAEVEGSYASGWENYAKKLEDRIEKLEKSIEHQNAVNRKIIAEKDVEIKELQDKVSTLEKELDIYKKKEIHVSVN